MSNQRIALIKQISQIFEDYAQTKEKFEADILSPSVTDGKLYEAFVLGSIAKNLVELEGCKIVLVNDNFINLKSGPGPINRNYPRLDILKQGSKIAEIWTDIEFLSYSYCNSGRLQTPLNSQYHELDIAIVDSNLTGRPSVENIWLAVECKNTSYSKSMLREILGVRRELSLLVNDKNTHFNQWPRKIVKADPPSCLMVFSTDRSVLKYAAPGELFSIDFYHEEMPQI